MDALQQAQGLNKKAQALMDYKETKASLEELQPMLDVIAELSGELKDIQHIVFSLIKRLDNCRLRLRSTPVPTGVLETASLGRKRGLLYAISEQLTATHELLNKTSNTVDDVDIFDRFLLDGSHKLQENLQRLSKDM